MELLHDLHFLRSAFSIYVLSDDGWSWALAWAQLGVDFICCVPFNGLALDQLKCLQNHSALGKLIHLVAPSVPLPVPPSRSTTRREGGPLSRTLVCGHFGAEPAEGEEDWTMLDLLRQTAGDGGRDPSCVALVSIAPNRRHLQARVRDALGPAMKWREIRHRNLGGLSSARLLVGWGGASSTCSLVEPGQRRAPTRPLDRFLERAVILAEWRKVDSSQAKCLSNQEQGVRNGLLAAGSGEREALPLALAGSATLGGSTLCVRVRARREHRATLDAEGALSDSGLARRLGQGTVGARVGLE